MVEGCGSKEEVAFLKRGKEPCKVIQWIFLRKRSQILATVFVLYWITDGLGLGGDLKTVDHSYNRLDNFVCFDKAC